MSPRQRNHFESALEFVDPEIAALVASESLRQSQRLELIASENYVSAAQLEVSGSILGNTTVEGYPGARFHGPSPNADAIEQLAIARACALFNARFANVQPHSGTQANQAIFLALLRPGDTVLAMKLSAGGHFSHGEASNLSGQWFNAVHYGVRMPEGLIDYDDVERQAFQFKPKLIIAGATAYPRAIDFERFAAIARSVNAHLMVDIAHVAGLVAAGLFPHPFPHADIITSTTYKNFRGVRGGFILSNDLALAMRIDAAVCPGLQGTPLVQLMAAKAVSFHEALQPGYLRYSAQVLANARALGAALTKQGIVLVTGGTDTPFVVADLRPLAIDGAAATRRLDTLGIGANKILLPSDPEDFSQSTGLRLGVSAITTRGMGEAECGEVADIVAAALRTAGDPDAQANTVLTRRVAQLCARFPLYGGHLPP
ncbi:MAG: serine hydroxymethyltransferase [Rhodoferax sp.]|uniref:serine hydroxymethyltransferase n=1 Tax=Rhodoferax sp. TaxID=50421 RepID=UPI00261D2D00|nr:serine hydroxymethyltransferase [Rhodoferax sp.]MDD5336276.1 serine hydroxymethyltransferase [Rhodoferax sp.]